VIPLLAESLKRQKRDLISAVAEVLLSFASAYDHIPPHRRLHLFTLLASSLGAEDSLFAVIVALVDRFPGNNGVYRFTAQLLRQFSTTEMLVTIQKYVGFIGQCFDKGSSAWKVLLKGNSGDEYQNKALQELLSVLPLLLVDESFQSKVKADMRSTGDISQTLAVVFGDILRDSINLLRALDQRKLGKLNQSLTAFASSQKCRSYDLCPRGYSLVEFVAFRPAHQSGGTTLGRRGSRCKCSHRHSPRTTN